jgi:Rhs element Vgr protein
MSVPSPLENAEGIINCSIQIAGAAINDAFELVSIEVHHGVNEISYASVVLQAQSDMAHTTHATSDAPDFNPGNRISLFAGYGEKSSAIFSGIIVEHALQITEQNNTTVRLLCKHAAVAMRYAKTNAVFTQQKDSDILANTAAKYAIPFTVETTTHQHEALVQQQCSDWDFMLRRAQANGMLLTTDGDAIQVGKPNMSSSPVLRLTYGESILSFEARLSAEYQPVAMKSFAWDAQQQTLLAANAIEPSMAKLGHIPARKLAGQMGQLEQVQYSMLPLPTEVLQTTADAALLYNRLHALHGVVSCTGSALAKPGTLIALEGVGEKFNGQAFVTAVEHKIAEGNWKTTISFGLEQPTEQQVATNTGMAGLHIATVQQISADPQANYRVLVRMAAAPPQQESIWARMASFYATASAGMVCYPELGDEVIVGFLEGDAGYPVILGSVYSKAHPPAHEIADDSNAIKSFTTRSKLALTFEEDKKIINLQTPAGNCIRLSEDEKTISITDQNSNSIRLSPDGIMLQSAKDVILKASGNIALQSTGKIALASSSDVTITGLNVTQDAQIAFTAKGNATAEISAAGQTIVKGAIVNIN